jgi:hypothetical protein
MRITRAIILLPTDQASREAGRILFLDAQESHHTRATRDHAGIFLLRFERPDNPTQRWPDEEKSQRMKTAKAQNNARKMQQALVAGCTPYWAAYDDPPFPN